MDKILPAYPLFIVDPYFSIWSATDVPTRANAVSWYGKEKPCYGILSLKTAKERKSYVFLGKLEGFEELRCTAVEITAFSTIYHFETENFKFRAEFISPLLPDDLEVASCPACYLKYEIEAECCFEEVTVALCLYEKLCYDTAEDRTVRGDAFRFAGKEVAYFGLNRQQYLNHAADAKGADWGYYYIYADSAYFTDISGVRALQYGGALQYPQKDERKYLIGVNKYKNIKTAVGRFIVAFDDVCSVNYFGKFLKCYYFSEGRNIFDALRFYDNDAENIFKKCQAFDDQLKTAAKDYGNAYLNVLYASLRQSVGAQEIVKDDAGRTLFLSKECGSNGCIATVDVSYPSLPLYYMYNPQLIKGMLYPILDFAGTQAWEYDFAPHDAGVYPYCVGQYYGIKKNRTGRYCRGTDYWQEYGVGVLPFYYQYPAGGELYDIDKQMPVEECGNMLIMCALLEKDTGFLKKYYPLLKKWADYLFRAGWLPSNQLCTDDFAGHQDKNMNLAVKSAVGLAAFAKICNILGEDGGKYRKEAESRAKSIEKTGMPLPRSFRGEPYSLKYNLYCDLLLKTNLFEKSVAEKEVECYLQNMNEYGVPLHSGVTYTKSDWMIWVAALTEDKEKQIKFINCLDRFLSKNKDAIPFSDWFDTYTGLAIRNNAKQAFQNRTVQGGCFAILCLKESLQRND